MNFLNAVANRLASECCTLRYASLQLIAEPFPLVSTSPFCRLGSQRFSVFRYFRHANILVRGVLKHPA